MVMRNVIVFWSDCYLHKFFPKLETWYQFIPLIENVYKRILRLSTLQDNSSEYFLLFLVFHTIII